ncbi:hypothetical protein ANN_02386 [Periplaneta americana]|uniref:Uncharacterized protein n=1 Tax=Periplaneta americana TaxID=6978 RepID=A0ABQ8TXS7_PERAM|nr:hypothetical protein ANN_02386 [Periplaneta americana]
MAGLCEGGNEPPVSLKASNSILAVRLPLERTHKNAYVSFLDKRLCSLLVPGQRVLFSLHLLGGKKSETGTSFGAKSDNADRGKSRQWALRQNMPHILNVFLYDRRLAKNVYVASQTGRM